MRTRRLTMIVLFLLAALALQPAAGGATFYVATTGGDGNDGSAVHPWLTLQHAVDSIQSGDTILVEPGTYVGCRMRYPGTAGSPKTLKAQTAGTVVVNAQGPINPRHSVLQVCDDNFGATSVPYWAIDGLTVINSLRYGIDPQNAAHLTVTNCLVTNSAVTGIDGSMSDYMLIENNTSYSNSEHGIYVNNSSDHGILRNNVMYSNIGLGVHMNGDISVQPGDGIMSAWTIERNVSYDNVNGFDADGVETSTWRNNLAYNNSSKSLQFTGGDGHNDGAICSRNNLILNNTFVVPSSGFFPFNISYNFTNVPAPVGNQLFNNILYTYATGSPTAGRGSIDIPHQALSGFASDYNIVMGIFGLDDDTIQYSFAQWQGLGYDLHSLYLPQSSDITLFANPSGNDYHLKAGSPAIDAGTTLAQVVNDLNGNPRPAGAGYDIGAYEYGSSISAIVATPLFAPAPGSYSQPVQVMLSCATGGAQVHYTIDGSDPTPASPLYSGTISVIVTETIKARGFLNGYQASAIAAGLYTIGGGFTSTTITFQQGVNGFAGWQDTWLSSSYPDTALYQEPIFWLQTSLGVPADMELDSFPIDRVPAGATVLSATLNVYIENVPTADPSLGTNIVAHRMLRPWIEAEATYNDSSFGVSWTAPGLLPGIDYDLTELGESSTLYGGENGYAAIDITTAVRAWFENPIQNPNYGVVLTLSQDGAVSTDSSKGSILPFVVITYSQSPNGTELPAPVFNPPGGVYAVPVDVSIDSSAVDLESPTSVGEIRYTTDGTDPNADSTLYTAPLHFSSATTIKAKVFPTIGYAEQFFQSQTAVAIYTFATSLEPPIFSPGPGVFNAPPDVTIISPVGGATIYYTVNGDTPTESSTLYTGPVTISVDTILKAICAAPDMADSDVSVGGYRIDTLGPVVAPVAAVPNMVRYQFETQVTLTGTATDFELGGSKILAAECYTDPTTVPGAGTAMTAVDGIFDSPVENITGTLDSINWHLGPQTIYIRAEDEAGNWGAPNTVQVTVASTTPPGTIRDLRIMPAQDYRLYYETDDRLQVSSPLPGVITNHPKSYLVDGNLSTCWQTTGTTTHDDTDQRLELQLGTADAVGPVMLGGLALVSGPSSALFPTQLEISVSLDGTYDDYPNPVARAEGIKVLSGHRYLWEFTPVQAQFVRISGPGERSPADGMYYWRIAELEVVESVSASYATMTWTAPADDYYTGAPCAAYDLRYSAKPITAMNFDSRAAVADLPTPGTPGLVESLITGIPPVGKVYMAIKSVDSVSNWSAMSNVATARVGRWRVHTEPLAQAPTADTPAKFSFQIGTGVQTPILAVSGSPGFPPGPVSAASVTALTFRTPLRPGTFALNPTTSVWRRIKGVANSDDMAFWRIEGGATIYNTPTTIFGQSRRIPFDVGAITSFMINGSDVTGGDIPMGTTRRPMFWWDASGTKGIAKFFIDVSTNTDFNLSDKINTIVLGGTGIKASALPYAAKAGEWTRMKALAARKSNHKVYVRVRGVDKDVTLECLSDVGTVHITGL